MGDCSPEVMTAVPRFYQNLYQKINSAFRKSTGLKKVLINLTLRLGQKKFNKIKLNFAEKIQNFLCERLVRRKIKNSLEAHLKRLCLGWSIR